jgi:branched-chain amino acid transport system substrate-binding protein
MPSQFTDFGLKKEMKIVAPQRSRAASRAATSLPRRGGSNSHYWALEEKLPSARRFNEAFSLHVGLPSDWRRGLLRRAAPLTASTSAGTTSSDAVAERPKAP